MNKYLYLLFTALCCTFVARAQTTFGIKGGYSSANMSAESVVFKPDPKPVSRFHAGLMADVPLARRFSLQPSLMYSSKGGTWKAGDVAIGDMIMKLHQKFRYNYLELPVNLLYKQPLGEGKLFGGFGPYIAYNLSGKELREFYVSESSAFMTMTPEIKEWVKADVEPFDAGANFTLGYESNDGFVLSLNYSLGLTDVAHDAADVQKLRYLGVSVGYFLHCKRH